MHSGISNTVLEFHRLEYQSVWFFLCTQEWGLRYKLILEVNGLRYFYSTRVLWTRVSICMILLCTLRNWGLTYILILEFNGLRYQSTVLDSKKLKYQLAFFNAQMPCQTVPRWQICKYLKTLHIQICICIVRVTVDCTYHKLYVHFLLWCYVVWRRAPSLARSTFIRLS